MGGHDFLDQDDMCYDSICVEGGHMSFMRICVMGGHM